MFSHETLHTVAAKSVIFEVGHTCTPISAWQGQTWGVKLEKEYITSEMSSRYDVNCLEKVIEMSQRISCFNN